MKIKTIILSALVPLALWGCFGDKGNYDYRGVAEVTIENVPDMIEVLANAESIVIEPRVVSNVEGVIDGDNPNFTFEYSLNLGPNPRWSRLNPSGSMNVDTLANFPVGTYAGVLAVTDTRSGIEYLKRFSVKVTSTTYEGWMVLCNDGPDSRVRMDMVSVVSADRIVPVYDLLSVLGLPTIHNATMIGFYPSRGLQGDAIYVLSQEGAYRLNAATLKTDPSWEIGAEGFIVPPRGEAICSYHTLFSPASTIDARAAFAVSTSGNAYALVTGAAGAAFEYPINTSTRGGAPEFRVSPHVGCSEARPGNGEAALFYDTDNRRFVGWRYGTVADARQTLFPLSDPENKLFSFNTGMELLHMEGTRFSGGVVYAVMQDGAGGRHVYAINMSGNGFVQESAYKNVSAPDFDKATLFAFHSQFPYMFYAAGNRVYLHNLGSGRTYLAAECAGQVTMLKFNLYRQGNPDDLNDRSDEFMARQFELMVGSYDASAGGNNGGRLAFYRVDGVNNSVAERAGYDGFGRIVDVVYRERR